MIEKKLSMLISAYRIRKRVMKLNEDSLLLKYIANEIERIFFQNGPIYRLKRKKNPHT